jgi:hypothetical protein
MSRGEPPAAIIAAAPPLLPPGVRDLSYGLLVLPYTRLSVTYDIVISGVFVFPITMTPAALSLATAVASSIGIRLAQPMVPAAVMIPAVSNESLIVTGTP